MRANICTLDTLIDKAPEDKILYEMSFMNPKLDKKPTTDDLFYEANDYYVPRDQPYYAALKGYDRVMREMQKWGMDLNPWFGDGEDTSLYDHTMLEGAAVGGSMAAMRLVLDAGGDMEDEIYERDGMALSAAVANGHENIVQLLLDKAAAVELGERRGYSLEILAEALVKAAQLDTDGMIRLLLAEAAKSDDGGNGEKGFKPEVLSNALLKAAQSGREGVVRLLLDECGELIKDDFDPTEPVLHAAVRSRNKEVVMMLLERGADVNQKDSYYESTPLIKAVGRGDYVLVDLLLEKGADFLVEDRKNDTALGLAARNGQECIVRLLLEEMERLENPVPFWDSAFMDAVRGGNAKIVRLLTGKGATVTEELVKNAVIEASRLGRTDILIYFSRNGADIRDCGCALYNAVVGGHVKTVAFLLENGADVHYKSPQGKSLLDVALYGHPTTIVESLLDAGITVTEDETRKLAVRSVLRTRGWREKRDGTLQKPREIGNRPGQLLRE